MTALKAPLWQRVLPWVISALCFVYLYGRLDRAAAAEGRRLLPYLAAIFESVSWSRWLMLMIPYCMLFFLVDSLVVWRVIAWFNTRLEYTDVLPIRASAYILSLVNEQVSKGAIALYLSRRNGIPGWEVGSSMLFIMFCEYYYLLTWATVGVALRWDRFPPVFHAIPWIALGSGIFFVLFHLFFSGRLGGGGALRDRPIFRAFRLATVWHYAAVIALRSPVMIAAVIVYTLALRLFGVSTGVVEMLGYLPVIFFGAATPGPMHSVAIVLWVVLFPERPGAMITFGFVQHNFFVLWNAAIGLLFLRRATRELFTTP
jgi:Flp pilus assembly protein protease CpaA